MKVQRSLLWPCVLALALVHRSLAVAHDPRQLLSPPSQQTQTTDAATTPTPTTTTPLTTSETSTTPTSTTPQTTSTPPTTTTPPATSTPQTMNGTPLVQTTTSTPPTIMVDTPIPTTSDVSTITSDGTVITLTITNSATSTSASASASATSQSDEDDGGGLSTGSIVGMSVAAGVAVIGIVAFFVWKLTRKRFNAFDDNEAIKWPELNSHSGDVDTHPLPTRQTGRSGFDTGSEGDLSRVNSSSVYSAPDLNASTDPYAVPPLPHLNPNQPYRDDPATAVPSGYYDPYRGPVPGTIENGGGDWQPEAYPMTQLGGPQAGRGSPAPDYLYEGARTQSPALPGLAPPGLYGGRSTPGLQPGYGGRASPGPQVAYSGGAVSPAPHAGYDSYGAR